ncbi:phloem protein 2-like protein, partial [Tanacetum coccineum]
MLQMDNLEHLKIPFKEIYSATRGFDMNHRIGTGGFGGVYTAELFHVDVRKYAEIKKSQLESSLIEFSGYPRRKGKVAIKRCEGIVGDVGLSITINSADSQLIVNTVGTPGYVDPIYLTRGPLRGKIDDEKFKDSVKTYAAITRECLRTTETRCLTMVDVVKQLKRALTFHRKERCCGEIEKRIRDKQEVERSGFGVEECRDDTREQQQQRESETKE